MFILTKKDKWVKEINDVKFYCQPPVGTTEKEISFWYTKRDNQTLTAIKENYDKTAKVLEKEYQGKKKPPKEKWHELIKDRIIKELDTSIEWDSIDELIDIVLCDWKGKDAPPFEYPPSQCLTMNIKSKISTWYIDLFNKTEDELKAEELKN